MRWSLRWLHRPFAALIAVWFVLVLVEPALLHSCPVHGDHGAPTATPTGGDASHDAHAAPEHAAHHAGGQAPGDEHRGCTCPDDCATAGASMAVPGAHVVASPATSPVARATIAAAFSRPSHLRVAFRIPFANGPPAIPRPA